MSLTETMRAVDQLGVAFWFSYLPVGDRRWQFNAADQAEVQRVFTLALGYAVQVGLTAEQVADAAFYGRRLVLAGKVPVCLAGRSFPVFAEGVQASLVEGGR